MGTDPLPKLPLLLAARAKSPLVGSWIWTKKTAQMNSFHLQCLKKTLPWKIWPSKPPRHPNVLTTTLKKWNRLTLLTQLTLFLGTYSKRIALSLLQHTRTTEMNNFHHLFSGYPNIIHPTTRIFLQPTFRYYLQYYNYITRKRQSFDLFLKPHNILPCSICIY